MPNNSILITGGAGFIGSNLSHQLLTEGQKITIFDNLSRPGSEMNINWLRETHGSNSFQLIKGDVTDFDTVCRAAEGTSQIYHLAGQVAVTTSVQHPRRDFYENSLGTFNVLEAARLVADNPIFIYSSTNKVYGSLENIETVEDETRFRFANLPHGISEEQPLDFHSPYGCSKGAGDQYTRDYARIYGLRTIVVRQSCIYGYRQLGIEDQGWLAWFIIAALKGRSINVFGTGKQVRDVLFIDDLLAFYKTAIDQIDRSQGQIYNIGGGEKYSISVWSEFRPMIEEMLGKTVPVSYTDARPGDQSIYISDIRKAKQELGWEPKVSVRDGITNMFEWIRNNSHMFTHL